MIQYDPISPVSSNLPSQNVTTRSAVPLTKSYYPENQGFETESGYDSGQFDQQGSGINWIAAIAQVFGNILNYYHQRKLQKEQQQFQYDYFDYTSNKQNAEYWKRVEYDTPFRQLQRFKDAGLSEALMYGTLGNAAGVSGNAPASASGGMNGSMPTALPFFDTGSVIQALLAPAQAMSQIGLNSSQAYKNYRSAGLDEAQATRLATLTPLEAQQYESTIQKLDQEFLKVQNETVKLAKDITEKNIYLGICGAMYKAQLKKIEAETFGIYTKADYDEAAAIRMARETEIVLPALSRSYNASADEKWQNVKRMVDTLDDYKREMKSRADVSEDEAETYFFREVLPTYLDLGIDVSQMIISRGLSIRGQNLNNRSRTSRSYETRYDKKGNVISSRNVVNTKD